jgi:hypothetical protein
MWTAIFIGVASLIAAVLTELGRAHLAALRQAGRDEAEADEARRDRELARKQAEVMAEMRSASDAADDMDDGRF